MKTMFIALGLLYGISAAQAFQIGAITPRPDCVIVPTDPADVNHPVTYTCNTRISGDKSQQPKREIEEPESK